MFVCTSGKMSGSEFEATLVDISVFNCEGLFPDADRYHVLKQPHTDDSTMALIAFPANDFDLQPNLGYKINVIHESHFIDVEAISSGLAHAATSARHYDARTKPRRYQRFAEVLTLKLVDEF